MDVKTKQLKVTDNYFHQMCRLCLSVDKNKTEIFLFYSEFEKEIADIIMECVPVHINKHDKMPTYICGLCFTQLKTFHQFQIRAVQSEKTLHRYLQQLNDCLPLVKVELDHEELSDNSENRNSNTDVTSKCEPFENGDEFDFSHSKENVQENTFSEEIFFKSEIKDEPIDDNSLLPIECVDTVQTLPKEGDGSEDSMMAFGDTNVDVEMPGNFESMTEKIFVESKETYEYMPIKDDNISLCPENFKDVECPRFNEDHLNGTEQSSRLQMFAENFRILLKKSTISAESKPHQCDICQMCFTKSSNLKRHKLIHTGEKPYQCEICKMLFREARTLKIHNLIHTGEKPYQCEICKMCFRTAHTLKKHNLIHTGEKPYQCDICQMAFRELGSLKKHNLTHTGEKPYQCDVCQMCFRHTVSLKNHKLEHTGEKLPRHKRFNEKSDDFQKLLLTKLAASSGSKSYQCDICQMPFSKSSNLKRHKLRHTGEKPHQCSICKMCFGTTYTLKKHNLIHTGEKPYQCDICKKRFRQAVSLKKHNLIHSEEKPEPV